MSYLLEALGRGLLTDLRSAFENQLPRLAEDDAEVLRARLAASPTSVDLALRFGLSCLRQMRLSDARRAFETAGQIDQTSAQPYLALACVYDELGQIDMAVSQLCAARERDPDDPAIAFALGLCQERAGRGELAKVAYRTAATLCPHLRNAHERLAAIALQERDWTGAIGAYERLAELEPGDLDILLTLGNLYLEVHRPDEAVQVYQRALLIEPEASDGALTRADALVAEGQLTEAIRTLERLIQKYPGLAPFHLRLADLYAQAGDDARAVAQYRTAIETQPGFLEATVKLGTQHMRQGRLMDAAVTFSRAVELNDRLIAAFAGLGVAQHGCGRTQEARTSFDLAAGLEPSSTLLFSEAARLQLQAERAERDPDLLAEDDDPAPDEALLLDEALRRHEQALLQHPNHADLHYRYGLLLRQRGRHPEAIQALRNAVTINPHYSKALIKLGIALKESGDVDDALATFQQAVRLNHKFVDLHYQLGLLFSQRSQFQLALDEFEQAVVGSHGNPEFRAHLALTLQNLGLLDRAAATWQSLRELRPAPVHQLAAREHALRRAQPRSPDAHP
jgi:tetratricopeptide (TPR) repeat protein